MFCDEQFYGKLFFRYLTDNEQYLDNWYEDPVIIHKTHPKRSYAVFDTYESFALWYKRIPESERFFDEVIREGCQKFRVDLDTHEGDIVDASEWKKIVDIFVDETKMFFNSINLSPKILLYDSSDKMMHKYSCHIVVSNYSFQSSQACKILASYISSSAKDKGLDRFMDTGIYKTTQNFRIEGSRKPNTNRYKYLVGHCTITDSFLDGMIGYTKHTEVVDLVGVDLDEDFNVRNISGSL